jgi:VWFA-related protein
MQRTLWSIFFGGVILVASFDAQEPSYRGRVDSVSVFATVIDASQRLVTGLRASDFEVFDNGVRQNIDAFSNDPQAFSMVMMLDRSGSMSAHFDRVRGAADVFIDHLIEGDRLRIGSFANAIRIDPTTFSSDPKELRGVLTRELEELGESPVWSATSAAMNALSSQPGRRVVFLFTDGHDATNAKRPVTFGELRERVRSEDVLIYAIGFGEPCEDQPRRSSAQRFQRGGPGGGQPGGGGGRGPGGPPRGPGGGRFPPIPQFPPRGPAIPVPTPSWPPPNRPFEDNSRGCRAVKPNPELRELTVAGGGGYFELDWNANLDQTFARVADELHQQYLLAFTPSTLDNTTHELEVRVKGQGRVVRARKSYYAGNRGIDGLRD